MSESGNSTVISAPVSLQVDSSDLRAEMAKISEEVTARHTREIFAATARPLKRPVDHLKP
ncbi:hypothetical protein [Phyllobacterium salinisoli]|uniref:hypothetical protein n=1 Tax=Phyllobacterium salinisoli TaxID=1899321 RepID=UPI0011C036C4|nr:hypothetical protein [Phyllobacterium salinisoli]